MKAFKSLEEALQKTLSDVKSYGNTTSPRGRESKELIGHGYVLTNPRDRIVGFKARNLNPYYLVGNLLWVLKQSNKLDVIRYYNPRGDMFSDDGEILRGAYGKRIFDFDGINQWNECYKELKLDPDSRRAIISIHLPQHDWTGSLDTPCTADFQFLLRDGKLHMVNHMRSQSAAFVQPYDVFLMTMLHELMASQLGVQLGIYKHICNSYHYFTNEEEMVNAIIESDDYTIPMPSMPVGTTYNSIKPLLYFEKEIREAAINNKVNVVQVWIEKLHGLKLGSYWEQFGYVLIARALSHTNHVDCERFIKAYLKDGMFSKLF